MKALTLQEKKFGNKNDERNKYLLNKINASTNCNRDNKVSGKYRMDNRVDGRFISS